VCVYERERENVPVHRGDILVAADLYFKFSL